MSVSLLNSIARRGRVRRGFTLVELMVASTMLVLVAGAVYSVMHQVLRTEGTATLRSHQRAAAEAIADVFEQTLERAMILSDGGESLVARQEGTQGFAVYLAAHVPRRVTAAGPRQYAYRLSWTPAGDEQALAIQLQRRPVAGSRDISPVEPRPQRVTEGWQNVEGRNIGRVDAVTLTFRDATAETGDWREQWEDAQPVAVRVDLRVGDQQVRRVVVPPARASFAQPEQEG